MRKIDKHIQEKTAAGDVYERASKDCREALRFRFTAGAERAARIDEQGIYINIDANVTLDQLNMLHAWAHDMLDEQEE